MEQKPRFFIYGRKEMGVLLLLAILVAIFAFTLGVHLGTKVGSGTQEGMVHRAGDAPVAATEPEKIPTKQELNEEAKHAQQAADDSLDKSLYDEVARTGIKMDTSRQVDLPSKAKMEKRGNPRTNEAVPVVEMRPRQSAQDPADAPAAQGASEPSEHHSQENSPESLSENPPRSSDEIPAEYRGAPTGKYTIQVGSYPAIAEAAGQARALERLGLKPFVRAAEIQGKGKWYRVCVGGYGTKELAEKTGQRYKNQRVIDSFVVSKTVD